MPVPLEVITSDRIPKGKNPSSPANQERFHAFYQGLDPSERDAVTTVLNMLCNPPFLSDGYSPFFRFWRIYRQDYDQAVQI